MDKSRLSYLFVARLSRGYLPETVEARERSISTTVDSLTYHSLKVRTAVKARLCASYRFLALLKPLIDIYGELSSVCRS